MEDDLTKFRRVLSDLECASSMVKYSLETVEGFSPKHRSDILGSTFIHLRTDLTMAMEFLPSAIREIEFAYKALKQEEESNG